MVEDGRTYVVTKSGYKAEFTNVLPEEKKDQEVILSVRPEEFLLNQNPSTEGITATVDDCVFLGLNTHYFVHLESGEEVEIIQESSIDSIIQPGTQIKLTLNTSKVNVFSARWLQEHPDRCVQRLPELRAGVSFYDGKEKEV